MRSKQPTLRRIFLLLFIFCLPGILFAQDYYISFTGKGASESVDSVIVENLVQGTVLKVNGSDGLRLMKTITGNQSIRDFAGRSLRIYPNPTSDYCTIEFSANSFGKTTIDVFEVTGKKVYTTQNLLPEGIHSFNVTGLKNGIYLLKINSPGYSYMGKLVSNNKSGSGLTISYNGYDELTETTKMDKSVNVETKMQYNAGERLKLTAYSGKYGTVSTTILSNDTLIIFSFVPCTDGDGDNYPVVQIGTKIWMAKNLTTTKYNDGTEISKITDNNEWGNATSPAYCHYYDSENNRIIFGNLYNWFTVDNSSNGNENVCPVGWHIPSDKEWKIVTDDLGGLSNAGGKLKETGTSSWESPNVGSTNETGFTALPGGSRLNAGSFYGLGKYGYWWSATQDGWEALCREINFDHSEMRRYSYKKVGGFSIRCLKDSEVPEIATSAVSNITVTSATLVGEITSDGGEAITKRGVCWSRSPYPTIAENITSDGTGIGNFQSIITGLSENTTYYVRAYATNSIGTGYGNEVSFLTLKLPQLTTSVVSNILGTKATCGGNITDDGGTPIIARGVCWSINPIPTLSDSITSDGNGVGNFVSELKGLKAKTIYYISAYATNAHGTGYGNILTFITQQLPSVGNNGKITNITQTSAYFGALVYDDGNPPITDRGICWSKSQNPTINDSKVSFGAGFGYFSGVITGFTDNTTYYARAFATNVNGTGYSEVRTFKTLPYPLVPIVTTDSFTTITGNSVSAGGNVTSDNGFQVYSRGICVAIHPNPTKESGYNTLDGNGAGKFTSTISKLHGDRTYYYRAYATNTEGTGYGEVISFKTLKVPVMHTDSVTNVTQNSVTCAGTILSNNGDSIFKCGVFVSTYMSATLIYGDYYESETKSTNFICNITGLKPNTKYYISSFAAAKNGMGFGNELSFTTHGVPTLTTNDVLNISESTATGGGVISNNGGSSIISFGVCWSKKQNPTIADSIKKEETGTANFTSNITGLTPNTTYYLRAYATNSLGTAYGNEVTFKTKKVIEITTSLPINITEERATCGGNITNGGESAITARGICWSINHDPTIADNKSINGTGTGTFTGEIVGLTINTTYYVRAYATNSEGTKYGNGISFITLKVPVINTNEITNITENAANSGGNVTSDVEVIISARGVCWGTNSNPTITNSKTTDGTGNGNYTSNLTGLSSNRKYNVRAYATYQNGTVYGDILDFYTLGLPVITTSNVSNITRTSATCGGKISSDGGLSIIARGVCWSTNMNPTIADNKTDDGTATGSFVSELSGLETGKMYFVRAYATNSLGTGYGAYVSFFTPSVPVLTTIGVSNILEESASSGGIITSDGGETVTSRGVCWSENENPTIADNITVNGTGTGSFYSTITGLKTNTSYYLRAYATNSIGTGYGNTIPFSTVIVTDIDGNIYHTVTIGSQIWLSENLKTTKYNDGTSIPLVTDNNVWKDNAIKAYCWNKNDVNNKDVYGALYNWNVVNTGKLCPTGWHIPSKNEWLILQNFLGGDIIAGGKMKSTGTEYWYSPNTGATNESGFNGLPGGYRYKDGLSGSIKIMGVWWTSTPPNSGFTDHAFFKLEYDSNRLMYTYISPPTGASVRCLKNQ